MSEAGVELSFEEALARLEEIVQRLEEGDLPLQEALALYEQGVALSRRCQDLLDEAELRVSQLVEGEEGVQEVPFEEEE